MLERLTLKNLGPAPEMDFAFGERVNLLTGDNGLGKTFVLDLAWWALTRSWPDGRVIRPSFGVSNSQINYKVWGRSGKAEVDCRYQREEESWSPMPQGRPPAPGLILYARIDGGFSVKDPERNYWQDRDDEGRSLPRPDSFHFSKRQLWWDGLKDERDKVVCRGLVEDWETWRYKSRTAFDMLTTVLQQISPAGNEPPLRPGEATRDPEIGAKDVPTLQMPYGPVPIHQASAGVQRILSLAYLIVWAWTEHCIEAENRSHARVNRIVLLWDEIEAHLHPLWQRSILPAVIGVLSDMLAKEKIELQVIATSHAPLVLASMETRWDSRLDRLFNLELSQEGRQVQVEEVPWARFGDASGWLTSPAFDLESGYSREAERAMNAADDLMAGYDHLLPDGLQDYRSVHAELERTLNGGDPFWPLWLPFYQEQEGANDTGAAT